MFSARNLTEFQAEEIAEAYYRSGRNANRMAAVLQVETFDLDLMMHPLVKRKVMEIGSRMRQKYTLEDHLEKLQEIRDLALAENNLKIALTAELSVGKAAGLYEVIKEPEPDPAAGETAKLSTEDIRRKLAQLGGPVPLPLPEPEPEFHRPLNARESDSEESGEF